VHAVEVHEVCVLEERVPAELKRTQAMHVVQAESAGDGAKPPLEGQGLDARQAGYVGSGAIVLQNQDLRIDPEPEQGPVQSLHRDPGTTTRVAYAFVYVQDSHVFASSLQVSPLSPVYRARPGPNDAGAPQRPEQAGPDQAN
jgi:hypothetical protein